ncbi:MAG: ComF family protein [Candidatus Korobacteraceae bacterium]
MQALLESIFGILFPSDCRLCHTPLDNLSRIPVCRECLAAIKPVRAPQCVVCGDRLVSAQLLMGDGRCANCRDFEPEFERAVSFAEYEDGVRGLIHLLKYEGVTPVAGLLGSMLAEAMRELLAGREAVNPLLIPVPLHLSRRQSRGFNQAELIARAAGKCLSPRLEVATGILRRKRDTLSQVGLSCEERRQNVQGAFRISDPARVKGRILIVVDDVMTTGATLSECAGVLKQAGAERVWAATVARAFQGASLRQAADRKKEEEEAIEAEAMALTASV